MIKFYGIFIWYLNKQVCKEMQEISFCKFLGLQQAPILIQAIQIKVIFKTAAIIFNGCFVEKRVSLSFKLINLQ